MNNFNKKQVVFAVFQTMPKKIEITRHKEIILENQMNILLKFKNKIIFDMKSFYAELIKRFKKIDPVSLKIMWNGYRRWKKDFIENGYTKEIEETRINKMPNWFYFQD